MKKYECPICKHVFSQKSNYETHIKRKNPCQPLDTDIVANRFTHFEQELARLRQEQVDLKDTIVKLSNMVVSLEERCDMLGHNKEKEEETDSRLDPNKYGQGKVYRIVDNHGQVYIGSTVRSLNTRYSEHKKAFRAWQEGKAQYCTSYEVLKSGINGIFLLEDYPCESKEQLLEREKYYVQQTPNCVNKVLPIK